MAERLVPLKRLRLALSSQAAGSGGSAASRHGADGGSSGGGKTGGSAGGSGSGSGIGSGMAESGRQPKVVLSNEALSMAQRMLARMAEDRAEANEGAEGPATTGGSGAYNGAAFRESELTGGDALEAMARPPRLGLGARFVSHNQAMGTGGMGGAGGKGGVGGGGGWREGVAQSAARTAAAVEERLAARLGGRGGKWGGRRREEEERWGGEGDGDGSDEEGEEESRAGRFGRRGDASNTDAPGGKKRKIK
ncbi:hypothetical protein CLOM_g11605 [Closterium sp. NIES-68]|nr:hypothetical protein CLOM_g22365 [Closterium sp. NIES-68]GJP52498.1 hypothetical protein CLOM_g11605 [Closterium sp. NIES-68]GJP70519.1 hypothetical protein CLOP_g1452 [Closterium sp. NIES-67]